ncbi:thioesterase family protein [Egibacter rhizosphaerae]|uniref:Thioesterase family protein n=1 Tax=Egibacter rhizosphaerae TaxID=1670831 RepID=A0A411YHL5_9ACTN|nr:thioesterase family protein [Egibacter rhizosphaerae]QBI20572.1 thioesterase family protein [Egibacter rhizosphaerae]
MTAFYEPDGPWGRPSDPEPARAATAEADRTAAGAARRVRATELTRGPWGEAQHGGPVAALLGGAIERATTEVDGLVARIAVELLRPVPIGALTVSAEVPRPGRRAAWALARVEASEGDGPAEVARAHAWVLRTEDGDAPTVEDPPPPPPEEGAEQPFYPMAGTGFVDAVDVRFTRGEWVASGPATAWFRLRVPVIADEEPSPLQRALVAGDCGNGISGAVDFATHTYVNPDLTVALHRAPRGEWVAIDARTTVGPGGIGLARTTIADRQGVVGAGSQSLLVRSRHGPAHATA